MGAETAPPEKKCYQKVAVLSLLLAIIIYSARLKRINNRKENQIRRLLRSRWSLRSDIDVEAADDGGGSRIPANKGSES